jgi:hypothetical protein
MFGQDEDFVGSAEEEEPLLPWPWPIVFRGLVMALAFLIFAAIDFYFLAYHPAVAILKALF